MNNALLIFVLIAGPLVAYVVVLTLPKWFARSLHGHRMWRLRDAVVDDILAGSLPRDHEAVRQLVGAMDTVLREKHMTLLDVYVVKRASRGVDPVLHSAVQKQGFRCPLDGLSAVERERVESYRERFMTLLAGSMLLGSWFGIAHIVAFVPAGLAIGMRQASVATRDGIRHRLHRLEDMRNRVEHGLVVSAREATDLAANKTRIGQDAAVFAMRQEVARLVEPHRDAGAPGRDHHLITFWH